MANRRPREVERPTRKRSNKTKKKSDFFDYSLLFIVLFLVAFGLVMVYSTSSYTAELKTGSSAYYLKRQGLFAVMGIAAMLGVSKMDYHWWKRVSLLMMYAIIALLILVLIVGKASNGSVRWIQLGPVQFQPSEAAKVVIVLYTAHVATIRAARIGDLKILFRVVAFPMAVVALIAVENLSTGIICAAMVAIIVFVTSPKIKQFFAMGGILVGFMTIFLLTQSYRMDRIKIWLHPEKYEKGYQTMQALYAIGSGGIFGKGLGQSIQKLGFIPESHNDMIFSVICEELGLFGAACVIGLFIILVWRCVMIAMSAPDLYGALIVVGVTTHIAVQVLINVAVVTNTIPPTGVPLPFISYG
ncbi:MAG: putative peptidoglycan glycosyltransferase FtsW, partial [Lachnospiraceae bacterium]|nr:putative peptidoglycan glycosyltransferase FtsW [Lachnospiraceae bacterium]